MQGSWKVGRRPTWRSTGWLSRGLGGVAIPRQWTATAAAPPRSDGVGVSVSSRSRSNGLPRPFGPRSDGVHVTQARSEGTSTPDGRFTATPSPQKTHRHRRRRRRGRGRARRSARGLAQAAGDVLVGLARFGDTGGVVVGKDRRGRVVVQGPADDLARVHARAVDAPAEQLLVRQHAVALSSYVEIHIIGLMCRPG